MLAEILQEMTGDYPKLTNVFVSERDSYMAHTLRNAAKPLPVIDESGGKISYQMGRLSVKFFVNSEISS